MSETMATADAVPVPLRRNRPFASFWVAQLLSNAGTQVSELAVPLAAVLVLTATPQQMGWLTAMESLPSLVLGVFLGVLVDRVRRGRLLVLCNLGQALAVGTVPAAALLGVLSLPQLYLVTFAAGGLALTYELAHTAYLPVLVTDRRQLAAANGAVSLSDSVTAVAGPGLGGVLVQVLTAPIAIAADAGSFLAAAALQLTGLRADPPPSGTGRLRASVHDGWTAFTRHRGVVALTVAKAVPDFFHWGGLALYLLYAVRELHLAAAAIGLIAMGASLGPVLAGTIAAPVGRRLGLPRTVLAATVLFGGANVLTPLATGPHWMVVVMLMLGQFLGGLGVVYLIITRATMLQRAVPPHLLGRVGSVMRLIEWGPGPAGGILGGLLGGALGLRTGLFVLTLGGLLAVPPVVVAAARGHLRSPPV